MKAVGIECDVPINSRGGGGKTERSELTNRRTGGRETFFHSLNSLEDESSNGKAEKRHVSSHAASNSR